MGKQTALQPQVQQLLHIVLTHQQRLVSPECIMLQLKRNVAHFAGIWRFHLLQASSLPIRCICYYS